jgi:hypothetical protein
MSQVFKKLMRAMGPRPEGTPPGAPDAAGATPEARPEAEGMTDIRRTSRMTSALDLKQGLEVSEPMPLDELPDDIMRELSAAAGEDAPTIRLRVSDLQRPDKPDPAP